MRMLLGLGGNIGDMHAHLDAAIAAIAALPHTAVLRESPRYVTPPWGYTDQAAFLNSVVEIDTALSPQAMLGACLGIEACIGRVRTFRYAPRVIDIDVLCVEGYTADSEELTVPHPRMTQRAFVLKPLSDLFEDGCVYGMDFSAAIAAMDADGIRRA